MSTGGSFIHADFPGGNIVIERVDGDDVYLRQDLRDTMGDWFFWYFAVRGAAGRDLRFHFAGENVFPPRGPAVSDDAGATWRWLGRERVEGGSFSYQVGHDDVRFSMTIPYLESNLHQFLARHAGSPHLGVGELCRSRKGRAVELLRLGRLDGMAEHRLFFTARHHACESVANYALEGAMDAILAETPEGRWFRANAECLVVPFVDKDGVEEGDQGKNRDPHDHNRDYMGKSIYPEVAAIRRLVPDWSGGRLRVAIDWHCPSIAREKTYLVGGPEPGNWEAIGRFSALLEAVQRGPLVYRREDNVPFGSVPWNSDPLPSSCARWAAGLPAIRFGATLEVPYGKSHQAVVDAQSARAFGADLVRALRVFLTE